MTEPDEPDFKPSDPPALEVEIHDPKIVGQLLGPTGEPVAFLLDRPAVAFGFRPSPA